MSRLPLWTRFQSRAGLDLIDEYRFLMHPLVLGRGKRFLRDGNDKTKLALERSETAGTGVTLLVCEPQA